MMGNLYGAPLSDWVLGICIVIVLIFGLLILYKSFFRSRPSGERTQDALDLLNFRYAKGEISDEEYNTKKAKLLE
jgi:putative membrane protein